PLVALGLFACKNLNKERELPNPDQAAISYRFLDDNTVIFENVTKGGFVSKWEFQDHGTSTQYKDTVFFGLAGTYKVKLTSNSKGGLTTSEVDVNIKSTSKYIAKPVVVERLDDWHIVVEDATSDRTASSWDFNNGEISTQQKDTVYFPFAGTYKVSLTSTTPIVTSTTVLEILVNSDDASYTACNETVFALLTGGCGDTDGKTWVVSPSPKKSWVGPGDNVSSTWYDYPNGLEGDGFFKGMIDNEYTFTRTFQYIPKNGNVSMGGQFSDKFFGTTHVDFSNSDLGTNGTYNTIQQNDPKHKAASFIYKTGDWDYIKDKNQTRTTGATIEIRNGSYIGWFSDNPKFYIVRVTADTLVLGHYYADETKVPRAEYGGGRHFTFTAKK
ncbi:MAG TPA: hypothetical protein VL947_03010, partial [Cytophagales bacterium]|nr:hypothetical protein [Cytophagales bacterium]